MAKHVITPAWQTSRGPLVQAHGCAEGVPVAGVKVFGETRQNLWVNPLTKTQNGMSLTSNADGSLTLNGTASEASYFYVDVYCLKPGARYTLSLDRSVNASISVQSYGDSGYIADSVFVEEMSTSASGTVSQDATKFRLMVQMNTGITISNVTVRVMLNEGPTTQPWCPPGLSSVSELETVTAGKNLVDASSMTINRAVNTETGNVYTTSESGNWHATETKIPCPPPGSSIVCSADSSHRSSIAFYFGDGTFISGKSISKTQVVTVPDGASLMAIDVYKDYLANFQLELGSTATPYEPPAVSTTPVDLSGHQLRSLPDGTRDVLSVDGSGAVSVDVRTHSEVWDGVTKKVTTFDGSYGYGKMDYSSVADGIGQTKCLLVDTLPITSVGHGNAAQISSDFSQFCIEVEGCDSSQALNDWLQDHPTTIVYTLATPQTVPLDPIAPPSIPAADASLWAASDVPCELEATTWTASGAEQGRQQAAMVKVAQQVRQQAETVAALAAQSLEA